MCVCVCSLSGDPVAHFSDRSSASVSLSVFQERPHVSPCAASLVARWRGGERCAVCVPPASTWPLTTRPVKVMLLQKRPSVHRCRESLQKHSPLLLLTVLLSLIVIFIHFIVQSDIMFMFGRGCYLVLTNH